MILNDKLSIKLSSLLDRYEELAGLLSDQEVIHDQGQFQKLAKEYAELKALAEHYQSYVAKQEEKKGLEGMLQDHDPEIAAMAKEELPELEKTLSDMVDQLQVLLLPSDPDDRRNVFLEIRAGAGGDEAAIFVGDLFRMYARYAESKGWKIVISSENRAEQGGYKEIIAEVRGIDVYADLKFESGTHRVQRVPVTESQGRVHTSTVTVAVLPEVEAIDNVEVNMSEVRVDTFRASGAGGQHVNKTDSAVRLTHLPTGIVVECQEERSQHKNKAKAIAHLQAKLLAKEREAQLSQQAATRRSLVGTGDRSERIRTYNFPQGRLTDHRIQLSLYQLPEIIEGALESVIEPLKREHQVDQLAHL